MQNIKITVGAEVFQFSDFNNWCDTAREKFRATGLSSKDVVCVDNQGRICRSGEEFMRARDDGSFPARVFKIKCEE